MANSMPIARPKPNRRKEKSLVIYILDGNFKKTNTGITTEETKFHKEHNIMFLDLTLLPYTLFRFYD